jgi:hypothetical protein
MSRKILKKPRGVGGGIPFSQRSGYFMLACAAVSRRCGGFQRMNG